MSRVRGSELSPRFVLKPGGPAVIITDAALATMNRFRQIRPRDKEAGGQLFALFDGADTVIVEATPPKSTDYRARREFRPNRWLQQREIRDRHARGSHFVGDWHTHPEPVPRPSTEDIGNMMECFSQSQHDLHVFVMLIIGTEPAPKGLHVALTDQYFFRRLIVDPSA